LIFLNKGHSFYFIGNLLLIQYNTFSYSFTVKLLAIISMKSPQGQLLETKGFSR
jgi:hypothetical protein